MLHKRKRSDSDLSTPSGSSPPAHLGGRTLKRYRDHRPSEETIHQNTLNLLFSAQKSSFQPSSPASSIASSDVSSPVSGNYSLHPPIQTSEPERSQSTLHRYWGRTTTAPSAAAAQPSPSPTPMSSPTLAAVAARKRRNAFVLPPMTEGDFARTSAGRDRFGVTDGDVSSMDLDMTMD